MQVTSWPGSLRMITGLKLPVHKEESMTWLLSLAKAMHGDSYLSILAAIPGKKLPNAFYKESLPLHMYKTLLLPISFFMVIMTVEPVLYRAK